MPSCHKMRKDRPQNVRFHFMLPSHCALEEWFNFIPLCFFFKTQRIITFKRSISEKSNSKAGHTIISEQRTAISKIPYAPTYHAILDLAPTLPLTFTEDITAEKTNASA